MDEENIEYDDERLLEIARAAIQTHTVEEALVLKKEQDEIIEDNFKTTWVVYNNAMSLRKDILKGFREIRIRMAIYNFVAFIFNPRAIEVLEPIKEMISESTLEIKDQKDILFLVKQAIIDLQHNQVVECNYNICVLLSDIYDKDKLLFDRIVQKIEKATYRIKGINVMSPTDYDEKIDELTNNIKEDIKVLGLKQ